MDEFKFIRENIEKYTALFKKENDCHIENSYYTTNVKGVFKTEWYYEPFNDCCVCQRGGGAQVTLAFDSYLLEYMTPSGRITRMSFVTEHEALAWYLKTKKKKGYKIKAPLYEQPICIGPGTFNNEMRDRIVEYATKRGFNEYYDVKIVEPKI